MSVDSFTKIAFLANGVSSLLGWNVVLACFDFFSGQFKGKQPATYFPIPLFVGYVVIVSLYNKLQKCVSYRKMIIGGLLGTNFVLAAMLALALLLPQTTIGYIIELALCFFLGIFGNITQLSFFAMINYLSAGTVSSFNIGTALSMLLTALTRIVILSIAGADSSNLSAIIIYFGIGLLVNFVDIYFNYRFFSGQTYEKKIKPHELHTTEEETDDDHAITDEKAVKHVKLPYYKHLWEAHKEIFPNDVLIGLNYVQTFMVFPAIAFERTFSTPVAWSVCIITMCYALGDTAGKAFCANRKWFNQKSIAYTFFTRFYFFWSMIMLSKPWVEDPLLNNDIFAYFNQFVFALTNGIVTSTPPLLLRWLLRARLRKGDRSQQALCRTAAGHADPGRHHDGHRPGHSHEAHLTVPKRLCYTQ